MKQILSREVMAKEIDMPFIQIPAMKMRWLKI